MKKEFTLKRTYKTYRCAHRRLLKHSRYLDTFLLGFRSDKKFVNQISKEVQLFIKSSLNLKIIKTEITDPGLKSLTFLGHDIKLFTKRNFQKRIKSLEAYQGAKKRIIYQKNLNEKKFLKIITDLVSKAEKISFLKTTSKSKHIEF